jgi:hypothetical protein
MKIVAARTLRSSAAGKNSAANTARTTRPSGARKPRVTADTPTARRPDGRRVLLTTTLRAAARAAPTLGHAGITSVQKCRGGVHPRPRQRTVDDDGRRVGARPAPTKPKTTADLRSCPSHCGAGVCGGRTRRMPRLSAAFAADDVRYVPARPVLRFLDDHFAAGRALTAAPGVRTLECQSMGAASRFLEQCGC